MIFDYAHESSDSWNLQECSCDYVYHKKRLGTSIGGVNSEEVFLFIVIFLVGVFIAGCDSVNDQALTEKQEGIIANLDKSKSATENHEGWYSMLVIPDIEDVDISKETENELDSLATENNGSYYEIDPDMYDDLKLDIGTKVIVYWDGSQDDSDPPCRNAGDIKVVSKNE